jgi:Protein of unknown function (DUF3119)
MKIAAALSLVVACTVRVGAFAPVASGGTPLKTVHQSTFTPNDFADPKLSLLNKLNGAKKAGEPRIESILEPNYSVALATAAAGPLISLLYVYAGDLVGPAGNCVHVVLASLLWLQTLRVRCVFEEDGFEFYNLKGDMDLTKKGARLSRKPGNFVTKTENKWSYDKVTGFQFYPSLEAPLICYFKETQTPERYNIPGEQPHFIPALFDAKQFKQEMEKRGIQYGV